MIAALLLTGCSYFVPARKLEDCEELVDTLRTNIIQNNTLMMETIVVLDSVVYQNELLKYELKKCQINHQETESRRSGPDY